MSQMILVTSFKGGVGKTTLSANLAACLAERGKKTLVCDCDLESRCLDMVLGMEEQPLFNICDVVRGVCRPEDAIIRCEKQERLFFMPAPAFYPEAAQLQPTDEIFTAGAMKAFTSALAERFDCVVFDLPARPDGLYRALAARADTVLVVSAHTAVSVRAAEKTAIAVNELCPGTKKPNIRLVVNGFHAGSAASGENAGLYEILSKAKLPLAGVIPYDSGMVRAQEKGLLAFEAQGGKLPFRRAVVNLARRLEGENIPLFEGIRVRAHKADLY